MFKFGDGKNKTWAKSIVEANGLCEDINFDLCVLSVGMGSSPDKIRRYRFAVCALSYGRFECGKAK